MVKQTSLQTLFQEQKRKSITMRTEPVKNRIERLSRLRKWIHLNRPSIQEAAYADFRKAPLEVDAIEIFHVLSEIRTAVDNLDSWTRPLKVDAPLTMFGTRSYIQYEPKGTTLIISPWNYPFSLAVGPLISSLAAGNTAFLKPSEHTPNMSALLAKMAGELFDPEIVTVIQGDADTAGELLRFPFDHIFFTGSPAVGKIVMKAAADNLASVTLELGGKSPTIVTKTANIREAAQRIAVAKFVNNGQTCIAPDFVLAESSIEDELVDELSKHVRKLFGGPDGNFSTSPDYCRIVNQRHHDRLLELVNDAISRGGMMNGELKHDRQERFIHPMILRRTPKDAAIMEEEIFGPILPVLSYGSLDEAITFINTKPKPLALYIFSKDGKEQKRVLAETTSGGVCVNDCGIHFLHGALPFGGVNNSGIGKSHGRYGFLAFSNEKPVLRQRGGVTSVRAFYPPYTASSKRLMNWFLKFF